MKAERFDCMISTGGIGGGSFFLLDGNHTIGREESRSGKFLKQADACKGHIISHYVQVLLGSDFPVKLVGAVGDDALGKELIETMKKAGLCTEFVSVCKGLSTLYAFCFLYPDESGGNLTVNNSASSAVTPEQFDRLEAALFTSSRPLVMAAPEVPLEARLKLLELGVQT
jgi:sugar/nucleoside kinase (ribokinase family)